jgi:WD40-like Beta Propeller Repeat
MFEVNAKERGRGRQCTKYQIGKSTIASGSDRKRNYIRAYCVMTFPAAVKRSSIVVLKCQQIEGAALMRSLVATAVRNKFHAVLSVCVLSGVACFGLLCNTLHAAPENSVTAVDAPTVRPIPVDTVLERRRFSREEPFRVSPDNQLVAFVSCGLADGPLAAQTSELMHTRTGMRYYARGCVLEVQNLRSGHRQQVNKAGFAVMPAWSPDGHMLAYYAEADRPSV